MEQPQQAHSQHPKHQSIRTGWKRAQRGPGQPLNDAKQATKIPIRCWPDRLRAAVCGHFLREAPVQPWTRTSAPLRLMSPDRTAAVLWRVVQTVLGRSINKPNHRQPSIQQQPSPPNHCTGTPRTRIHPASGPVRGQQSGDRIRPFGRPAIDNPPQRSSGTPGCPGPEQRAATKPPPGPGTSRPRDRKSPARAAGPCRGKHAAADKSSRCVASRGQ